MTPTEPSPTESVGCEPHGDHWHCEGPAETSTEDEEEASTTETPTEPSPTESVGCEPHGDHWHCEGPVETGKATTIKLDNSSGYKIRSNFRVRTGAAGHVRSDVKMFAGVAAVVAAACYV